MLTKNIDETSEEKSMWELTEVSAEFEDLWIQDDDTTKKALLQEKIKAIFQKDMKYNISSKVLTKEIVKRFLLTIL